jgi:hypothetical protein
MSMVTLPVLVHEKLAGARVSVPFALPAVAEAEGASETRGEAETAVLWLGGTKGVGPGAP